MGLRDTRNTPCVTSAEVALGFVGFMVVLDRTKVAMAVTPKAMPTNAIAMATPARLPKPTSAAAASEETSHISRPNKSATTGGGTLSSSALNEAIRSSQPYHRLELHGSRLDAEHPLVRPRQMRGVGESRFVRCISP